MTKEKALEVISKELEAAMILVESHDDNVEFTQDDLELAAALGIAYRALQKEVIAETGSPKVIQPQKKIIISR